MLHSFHCFSPFAVRYVSHARVVYVYGKSIGFDGVDVVKERCHCHCHHSAVFYGALRNVCASGDALDR